MPDIEHLDRITLPQSPRSGKTLEEYSRNVESWARECERTLRALEAKIVELVDAVNGP